MIRVKERCLSSDTVYANEIMLCFRLFRILSVIDLLLGV